MDIKDERPSLYHITLLRHGQSVGNAKGYHQGQADFPLTDLGKAQAQALLNHWIKERVTFDRIVSSPLLRASQTAKILSAGLNIPLEFDDDLMERNNGRLAGLQFEKAAILYPRPNFISLYAPIAQTGESQWELYLRAGRAVLKLLRHPPGRYLVVSHGGILNMVMHNILGIAPMPNFHGAHFSFHNTSFAMLTYNPEDHSWFLDSFNDRCHWNWTEDED